MLGSVTQARSVASEKLAVRQKKKKTLLARTHRSSTRLSYH